MQPKLEQTAAPPSHPFVTWNTAIPTPIAQSGRIMSLPPDQGRPRIAFIRAGGFSHVNRHMLEILQQEFGAQYDIAAHTFLSVFLETRW